MKGEKVETCVSLNVQLITESRTYFPGEKNQHFFFGKDSGSGFQIRTVLCSRDGLNHLTLTQQQSVAMKLDPDDRLARLHYNSPPILNVGGFFS